MHFSVTASSQLEIGLDHLNEGWAHLGQQQNELIQHAKEAIGDTEISIESKGPIPVLRGTILTVRLKTDICPKSNPRPKSYQVTFTLAIGH